MAQTLTPIVHLLGERESTKTFYSWGLSMGGIEIIEIETFW